MTIARRGLTLLEILVSLFVLAVGLLGVAALLPFGSVSIAKMNVADRTGACGRAGLRDLRARELLDYQNWIAENSKALAWTQASGAVNPTATTMPPFVLDPIGVAKYATALSPPTSVPNFGGTGGPLARLSLTQYSYLPTLAATDALTLDQANSLFLWRDDVVYHFDDKDPTLRPQGRFMQVPVSPNTMGATVTAERAAEENYSWFVTVVPSRVDEYFATQAQSRRKFTASVVVCNRRGFDTTAGHEDEFTCSGASDLTFTGGTWSGGLTINNSATYPFNDLSDFGWLLLYGTSGGVTQCDWYRVVSKQNVDTDGNGSADTVYLTLAGPDWTIPQASTQAVFVRGVTGVYTTSVEVASGGEAPLWLRKG